MKTKNQIIFILLIITSITNILNINAKDISEELKSNSDPAITSVIKLPTEIGFSLSANYLKRNSNDNGVNLGPSLFLGPGLFFDYRFNNSLTFSMDSYFLFDQNSVYENSKTINLGFYIKHWINSSWGYIGLGFEYLKLNGELNNEKKSETDYMLTIIFTGENVRVKNRLNSVGDLRLGISFSNNSGSNEIRYSVKYSIGVAFEIAN